METAATMKASASGGGAGSGMLKIADGGVGDKGEKE